MVEEQIRLPNHSPRPALHKDSFEAAVFLVAAEGGQLIHIEMHVARDKQIDVPIFVIVCPGCARAESACCYASLLSNIFKFAIAQIVIERISALAGHVDIRKAVMFVMGDATAISQPFAA